MGEIDDQELESVLEGLRVVVRLNYLLCLARVLFSQTSYLQGNENLGMAMTFTLVSHLREQLSHLMRVRAQRREREEKEKERLALEVGVGPYTIL